MLHRILFSLLFFSFSNLLLAQNTILLETEEREVSDQYSKVIPQELLNLIDADEFISSSFSTLSRSHLYNDAFNFNNIFSSNGYLYGALKEIETDVYSYDILRDLFFKNKSFYEPLYNIVMPNYKTVVSKMTNDESDALIKFLKDGLGYAKSFNLEKEQSDEEKLNYFFVDEKGELNAFIYRRILAKHLTKEECVFWLERIIKDLELAIVKKEAAGDCIIVEEISPSFYWAKKFGQEMVEWQILKKENNKYLSLTNESIESTFNCMIDVCIDNYYYVANYKNGQSEIFLLNMVDYEEEWDLKKIKFDNHITTLLIGSNSICVLKKDKTVEYLERLDDPNSRKIIGKKSVESIAGFYSGNSISFAYEDGTSELFIRNNLGKIVSNFYFEEPVLEFVPIGSSHLSYLTFENLNTKFVSFENPEEPRFVDFYEGKFSNIINWKNYLIAISETNNNAGESLTYTLLSMDGKLLMQPSTNRIYVYEQANYLLVEETTKNGTKLAFFDGNLNKISKPVYNFGINFYWNQDSEYSEEEVEMSSIDNTLILQINKYKKGKIVDTKALMFDKEGTVVIPPKYGNISRINPLYDMLNCLYVVCNKVKFVDSEIKLTGKFAFFNHQGKQLTDFIYDKVYDNYNEKITAIRDGIEVEIDAEGREINY